MVVNRKFFGISAGLGLAIALASAPLAAPAAPSARAVPARVSIVFPLSVPSGAEGFIDSETLAAYTEPGGFLSAELDAIEGTDVAIGVDPMIIASIRLLGSEAPATAVAWLTRLEAVSNETFALTYADSDITLALQAGSPTVLAPSSLEFAINPDRFGEAVAETPTPSPTETVSPVDPDQEPDQEPDAAAPPPLPSTESLLAWEHSLPALAWPQPKSLGSGDLSAITGSGFDTTILDSASVSRVNPRVAATRVGKQSVLVSNSAISTRFAETIEAFTDVEWQQTFRGLGRSIATARGTTVIAIPRGSVGNHSRLLSTIDALDALTRVETVPLSVALAESPTTGTLSYHPRSTSTLRKVGAALEAEREVTRFSSVAENPILISGERRIRLLASLAPQWSRYEEGFDAQLRAFRVSSDKIRTAVEVAESSDLLFGDRGFIPINVSNSLNQPVTVIISIRPLTPVLKVENSNFELEIEPDSQRRAQIPAAALSNGVVSLEVSMRTKSGVPIGSPTFVKANVQAGWETPLTIGLGIFVVIILVVGLVRSIRKRRKVNAEMRAESAAIVRPEA